MQFSFYYIRNYFVKCSKRDPLIICYNYCFNGLLHVVPLNFKSHETNLNLRHETEPRLKPLIYEFKRII